MSGPWASAATSAAKVTHLKERLQRCSHTKGRRPAPRHGPYLHRPATSQPSWIAADGGEGRRTGPAVSLNVPSPRPSGKAGLPLARGSRRSRGKQDPSWAAELTGFRGCPKVIRRGPARQSAPRWRSVPFVGSVLRENHGVEKKGKSPRRFWVSNGPWLLLLLLAFVLGYWLMNREPTTQTLKYGELCEILSPA